jgi:endonuclease YncB( thermonuclease family)
MLGVLVLAFLLAATSAEARPTGPAIVIDGDTIDVAGERVRLFGIDAPELGQTCTANARRWRCGQQAATALAKKIGTRSVSCAGKGHDQYGRTLAVCRVGRTNLNAWLVTSGWALAYREYSTDYVAEEDAARAGGKGMWRGAFVPPWDWRRGLRP